jgi:hypothetical protein
MRLLDTKNKGDSNDWQANNESGEQIIGNKTDKNRNRKLY